MNILSNFDYLTEPCIDIFDLGDITFDQFQQLKIHLNQGDGLIISGTEFTHTGEFTLETFLNNIGKYIKEAHDD